jgi:glycosyltransferase involved in cell wall biosynthesis
VSAGSVSASPGDARGAGTRVSVGLPVYNGERFVEHAISSLLAQTYPDFELIISDNSSTDGTEEICRRFAAQDSRIRYIRHPENRGAAFNWNFVVRQARGTFFKWASANDYCHESFIRRCLDILEADESVVLCYTRTRLITDEGVFIAYDKSDFAALDERPRDRFLQLMGNPGKNNAQSGLIRLQPLLKTRLERPYPHGDKVLMAELALYGKFWLIDEPLFFRRMGPASSATKFLDQSQLAAFIAPGKARRSSLNLWSILVGYLMAGVTAPIPPGEKAHLLAGILRRIAWKRAELWHQLKAFLRSRVAIGVAP